MHHSIPVLQLALLAGCLGSWDVNLVALSALKCLLPL
jgi:hypothetical protein